jgi:hypothetical protein
MAIVLCPNRAETILALTFPSNSKLTEHFQQETWHPKGCWAMDLILEKN